MAPLIAQADMAVVTKTDLVSQAEKEVFREYIKEVAPSIDIIEKRNARHRHAVPDEGSRRIS